MRRRDPVTTPLPVTIQPITDAVRTVREREPLVRSVAKAVREFLATHIERERDDAG